MNWFGELVKKRQEGKQKRKGESSSQPEGESSSPVPTPTPPEDDSSSPVSTPTPLEDDSSSPVPTPTPAEGESSSQAEGESSSQPEKEPEAENNKGKEPEEAENTKEDKDNKIYPGEFDITWGNDTNYWIQPTEEKPKERAELKKVCWLQVTGSKDVARGKSYEIKFNITLKTDAFGWNGLPLFLMAKIGAKGKSIWKKIKPLEQTTTDKTFEIPDEKFIVPIPAGEGNEKLFFGLYEIWSNKWKGGLYINHATVEEVRPEHVEEVRPEDIHATVEEVRPEHVEEVRPQDVAVNEG